MAKSIKILGTGCPKCKTLTTLVQDVVNENNMDATIEKVEDIMDIMAFNVMSTPAIVIDNVVVLKGRIPSKNEVLELLKTNIQTDDSNSSKNCCSQDNCC